MATGKIKNWIGDRGFGFIVDDAGGPDVFLHINEVPQGDRQLLKAGTVVNFEVQETPKGLAAHKVRLQGTFSQQSKQSTSDKQRSASPSQETGKSESSPGDAFHNPYTFVPTPPRPSSGFAGDFDPLKCDLDHASLKPNLWTGYIPIKLTTVTPLVLLKTDGEDRDTTQHQTYDVLDYIPESSLRGMLRSAYEVVTNSRYGCFRNDEQLAYRMHTTEAVKLIPAIIKQDKGTNELKACLYTGTTQPNSSGPKKPKPKKDQKISATVAKKCAVYAAMLTCYGNRTPKTNLQRGYSDPKTGDKVYAEIILCDKSRYLYWKASRVWRKEDCSTMPSAGNVPKTWKDVRLYKDQNGNPIIKVVEGTILITNNNIDRKHDERIFFCDNPIEKVITDNHKKAWEKLIKNYRDAHSDDEIFNREDEHGNSKKPWHWFKKNRDTTEWAWSPHLYHRGKQQDRWGGTPEDVLELKQGDMVYARCEYKNGNIERIKDLFPVMISRELYENTPEDLLDASLQPATELDQLSPADRLFGWTPQGQGSDGGYKSRLRVVCENGERPTILKDFKNAPLPLTILGEPKPEQGRFYVAKDDKPQDGESKQAAGYDKNSNKQLRGRKHYWHHKGLEPDKDKAKDYWDPCKNQNQEYIRTDRIEDPQNRSVNGWIKPETEFEATLYVQNLRCEEIGALLWLLTLNNNLGESDDKHYFKLGYGKPVGFGSVKIEIDENRLVNDCLPLGMGNDWKTYYAKFDACPPATMNKAKLEECRRTFMHKIVDAYNSGQNDDAMDDNKNENSLSNLSMFDQLKSIQAKTPEGNALLQKTHFDGLPFISAFRRVLQGPVGDAPIHYPRLTSKPDPDGKNYAWFVANERGESRDKVGKKLALPDVTDDEGLPYIPSDELTPIL